MKQKRSVSVRIVPKSGRTGLLAYLGRLLGFKLLLSFAGAGTAFGEISARQGVGCASIGHTVP